ncbi:hypothetical protein, conserved [Eimeria maxima]|uniref:ABC1 atypical kinase-like domain-containing protein n=1 Tax=Eimeria maxima TaxID=5804 RepID=U6M6J4_EIMMA|nr:hypothetical protein, conserved [Eimeria maxima]CDJ57300.1 hypothetical protein, conserved [Eimeria maxima]
MLVVDSQLQLRRGALDSVTALQPPFGVDTEHFFSPAFTIQGEGRRVTPLAIFHSEKAHTSPETVSMSANDYMQDTLARSSDSQTQRRCGANPIPALTIAAAAVFAFPIKWGGKGNASHQYGKEDDMDAVQTGDGSTTHCKTIEYGPESTVCTYQRVHPWRPAQHALTLIGRGLQALQQYIIVLTEQLGGGHGGLLGAPMRVKDASRLLWQVFQDPLEIMGSAVNQALGVVILHKDKVCNNTCPEAINKIQPVQGDHSSEKRQVGEKHADANSNTFSGEWALDTSCTRFRPDTWVGDLPEDVECSPGVQHHSAQPKMLDSSAPSSESGSCVGVNHLLSMLMASYRALLLFIRTFGSVLLRLIHVVPLGLTAATAGFWLLGLPYLSVCLRTIGLGSNWVLHWEAIAQRELEEVMFMAVTAAASAAGPTYVKFLQWIATRPDLFHESLCSRCARPIGCGCIAQVYRAYLLLSNEASEESKRTFLDHAYVLGGSSSKCAAAEIGGGNKLPPVAVAVKVMRPGVREAMEFDLRVMLLVASVLQLLPAFGFVALKKSVEEFAVSMRRQLDFGLEEKHLKLFRSNFGLSTDPIPSDILPLRNRCRRHSEPEQSDFLTAGPKAERHPTSIFGSLSRKILGMRRQVTFPYPFEALSSSEVIVMTLESGFTLNQLFKTRAELQKQDDSSRIQRSIRRDRGPSMTKLEPGGTSGVLASPAAQKIIEV